MRVRRYDPHEIEPRWQQYWEEAGIFRTPEDSDRPHYYCLEMFPYPSGRIHMGHVRNYTIGDVVARYKRMQGFAVLHPMGWDAFGLPAENAAIEQGVHPADWTRENIDYMRRQLRRMGFSYDWSREIATCEDDYYRWNQWFFLKMYERGLAYRRRSPVNWCISCETVLANEQVIQGRCWRCDSPVEERDLEQWFFRITAYADELLEGCDRLSGWPERVLVMQRNWIGRSRGVEMDFPLAAGPEVGSPPLEQSIRIFTTRPDTLFGATFLCLAPEHPLVEVLIRGKTQEAEVRAFVERVRRQDRLTRTAEDQEKEGVFTGAWAINPVNGLRIPVWVANFVLMEYGTGAIMCVPAHDQRDFEFARKYRLPVRVVIQPPDRDLHPDALEAAYTEPGRMVDSGPYTGMASEEAWEAIARELEARGIGRITVQYRLRDWGISRQRYWGTPIPIIYCEACGLVPVPEKDLPVRLPREVPFTGKGGSPLAQVESFVKAACPQCGRPARRETDTMDTFVDSSWYFLRYITPRETERPFDPEQVARWMPVDQYIGGIEHAVLHLLYARFFTRVLRDLGLLSVDEPFARLLTQGMVIKDGAKMSKSRGNVVDPDHLIQTYGADTARLFSLFAAPPEKDLDWSDRGVEGASRFLSRVYRKVEEICRTVDHPDWSLTGEALRRDPDLDLDRLPKDLRGLRRRLHRTVQKVTRDTEAFQFNTAISFLMELVNHLYGISGEGRQQERSYVLVMKETLEDLVRMLAPFVPHLAEELWRMLGHTESVALATWPVADPEVAREEVRTLVIQVNGKVRSRVEIPADLPEAEIRRIALEDPKARQWMGDRPPRKVIVVRGRLVNIVV